MPSTLTQTDIANLALTKMGQPTIADLGDDNERARTMNAIFVPVRDRLIRESPWNFAMKRVTISADPVAPEYGLSTRYAYPADMLSMISTENTTPYRLEGNFIHSNVENSLKIRYVARITDTTQYDTYFVDAFAAQLAVDASLKISNSLADKNALRAEAETALVRAKKYDGQEDDPQARLDTTWDLARRSTSTNLTLTDGDGSGSL